MSFAQLSGIPFFQGIPPEQIPGLLDCLEAQEKQYEKGEFIFLAASSTPMVGVVLNGSAQIIRENILGDRMIIGTLHTGDLFGETYACMGAPTIPVSVSAIELCHILLFDINRILHTCSSSCTFHQGLIQNLMRILARKNILLNKKMSYLSHKTIRSRLEAYFLDQVESAGSSHFTLPFNRSEMADYLCVDRSALSRELASLKAEGALDYHRNAFVVYRLWGKKIKA